MGCILRAAACFLGLRGCKGATPSAAGTGAPATACPRGGRCRGADACAEQTLPSKEGVEDECRFKKSSFLRKRILKMSSLENGENI